MEELGPRSSGPDTGSVEGSGRVGNEWEVGAVLQAQSRREINVGRFWDLALAPGPWPLEQGCGILLVPLTPQNPKAPRAHGVPQSI